MLPRNHVTTKLISCHMHKCNFNISSLLILFVCDFVIGVLSISYAILYPLLFCMHKLSMKIKISCHVPMNDGYLQKQHPKRLWKRSMSPPTCYNLTCMSLVAPPLNSLLWPWVEWDMLPNREESGGHWVHNVTSVFTHISDYCTSSFAQSSNLIIGTTDCVSIFYCVRSFVLSL